MGERARADGTSPCFSMREDSKKTRWDEQQSAKPRLGSAAWQVGGEHFGVNGSLTSVARRRFQGRGGGEGAWRSKPEGG